MALSATFLRCTLGGTIFIERPLDSSEVNKRSEVSLSRVANSGVMPLDCKNDIIVM